MILDVFYGAKYEDVNRLNNSALKDVLQMIFGANKMPVKIIKEMQLEKCKFRIKLVKMIEDADSKFDDYSHWCYELIEKYLLLIRQTNA